MESYGDQFVALAEKAVGFAKAFEKKFDYSEESVSGLEEILEHYHRDLVRSEPEERQVGNMALIWGAYLGETMLRNGGAEAGYTWAVSNGRPILQKLVTWEISPIGKVEKRLREGEDESIRAFYEIGMLIIEGKLSVQ